MPFKRQNLLLLTLIANSPMIILFLLMLFEYVVYASTYLIPLLIDKYEYGANQQFESHPKVLVMLHEMRNYVQSFLEDLSSKGLSPSQQKGITYAIVLHCILLMFIISTFRVMRTNPGAVPDEWNNAAEKEINELAEAEMKKLKKIARKIKKHRQKEEEERQLFEEGGNDAILDMSAENPVARFGINEPQEERKVETFEQNHTVGNGEQIPLENDSEGRIEPSGTGATEDLNEDSDLDEQDEEDEETRRKRNEEMHKVVIAAVIRRKNKRYCDKCEKYKPVRSHHCHQCGTCVLKMDHHCPWVSTCIGFYNYKFFINMVFYGDLLAWFIAITYTELIQDVIFGETISSFKLYLICLNYLFSWVFSLIILVFFCFHLWLIANGKTTLEFCEKKHYFKPYDFGVFVNFRRVLGNNIILWLLPLSKIALNVIAITYQEVLAEGCLQCSALKKF